MTALSPRSDAGGILHCPSPTSFHSRGFHIHKELERDPRLLQIQRSLSRSPSKSPIRLTASASSSPSPSSPLSPTRNDTRIQTLSTSISAPSELQVPSALSTPHQAGARKTRISSRRQSPLRNPRFTITPKSPRKRTLQESSNNGNSVTRSSRSSSEDQENRTAGSVSPERDSASDGALKQTTATSHSIGHAPPRATARFELGRGRSWGAKSSPLKRSERSDGLMNMDSAQMGSPSAKRRSLHGGILNSDFDIFEQAGRLDSQDDTQMSDIMFDSDRVVAREQPSPMLSRSSSLRPTTVQQRNEKPSLVRSRAHPDIAAEMATPGYVQSRNRARQSLDSALLPMQRDSPFSSQGSLPNASAHPIPQSTGSSQGVPNPRLPARHPLSRTISQSTSTSSMAEDSPTHIPTRQPEQRRPQFNFSKTMPSGTSRPISRDGTLHSQDSSGASFATPENYKLVKPHAAAFGSTGLISKRTRNTQGSKPNFGASTSTMPDTPCKRHSIADMPSPSATAHDEIFPRGHHKGVSFGEPSTPFNPKKFHTTPASFGKGVNIFGSQSGKGFQRKDSFFGFSDVEDDSQSPSGKVESQSSTEYDIPPTPSRQLRSRLNDPPSPFLPGKWREGRGSLTLELAFGSGVPTPAPAQFCKSISISRPEVMAKGDNDDEVENPPLVGLRFEHFLSVPRSFTYSRLLRNSKSPTPLNQAAYTAPAYLARREQAKSSPLSPASPPESRTYRLSPRTPRDHMLPPDPSGLSISQHGDEQIKGLDSLTSSASILPPATPTASKEYFALSNRSRLGATPSHKPAPVEIDSTLTSRFHDVQVLGIGEFSQVFRVSGKRTTNQVGVIPRGADRRLSLPDQKWAVKKSRKAFMGPRDRERKMKEVEILKALGKSDHTVEFIDSWEHRGHLYIQTEFCEEGSLDMFLDIKGRNARLDDFRIWKVLEDLTLVSRGIRNRRIHPLLTQV